MNTESNRARILIVDDIKENIDVLAGLLSDYQRTFAPNGEKALAKASSDPMPDLILLDVMMPDMDGFEVCRRLQADPKTRDIPIIFATARGEEANETKGIELGAVDYVTKPFKPAVVRARVKTHLKLKQASEALQNQNVILEKKVAERTVQLRRALREVKEASLETIIRLSRAAEYKDDDTGEHVFRMSHYSAAVARKLGLGEDEADEILHAAPMHDIGKIGIPDRVLLKPGKLDADEWNLMRQHCEMGAAILAGSEADVIKLGEIVAMTHHEKWNGTGYPRGLKGTDIPIAGRVVAIADVFDALTSKRPYKEPFSLEKSFRIIREGRAEHFDPDVVDAFFAAQDEILRIKEQFQDNAISPLNQRTDAPEVK